ncbi:hypothetical protein [Actinoplanes sp. G11-F43]|uniref:hypothetical protein n=1 Tax=Actinoplanes sp. G11-F43 TaxID=3424130 RepID=UPI003D346966
MIDAELYVKGLAERLAADGCQLADEHLGLVGYKTQVKALTRRHIFLVAAKAGTVDQNVLADFAADAVALCAARQAQQGGGQSSLIVLPALIAEVTTPDAVGLTLSPLQLNHGGFEVLAQPALVDLSAGVSHRFREVGIFGYAYSSLIKQKLALYLPDPA